MSLDHFRIRALTVLMEMGVMMSGEFTIVGRIQWFPNRLKTGEQHFILYFYYPLQQIAQINHFFALMDFYELFWFGFGVMGWSMSVSRAVLAWKAKVWKVPAAVSWTCPKRIRESQLTQTYIIYKAPGYFIVNFQLQPWPMKGPGWVTWYHPKLWS